jgi:hypothetical protein
MSPLFFLLLGNVFASKYTPTHYRRRTPHTHIILHMHTWWLQFSPPLYSTHSLTCYCTVDVVTAAKGCLWDGTLETCAVHVQHDVVFLGDSTMSRLALAFQGKTRRMLNENCPKHATRCDFAQYLSVSKGKWTKPPPTCGPTDYGLQNPWCTDCSGCNAFLCENETHSVEYLPVEFACDVEIQTARHVTTQSVVANYLRLARKRLTCVVNAGIHDEILDAHEPYTLFVMQYVAALQEACFDVVWITTSSVQTSSFAQKNERIATRNTNVLRAIPSMIKTIDVFNATNSGRFTHADNVHMEPRYYETLSRLFKSGF